MKIDEIAGIRFIRLEGLADKRFVHAFGTIDTGESRSHAHARIKSAFPEIKEIATARQVHGRRVVKIEKPGDVARLRGSDADVLITNLPGVAVAVRTADCTPVLIIDPRRKAVAAIHAGWKGTAVRSVEAAVAALQEEYGSRPSGLLAGIGPCIGPCHYQVDQPVIGAMRESFGDKADSVLAPDGPTHARLDLTAANRIILIEAGLDPRRIFTVDLCTYHHEMFFSYRRQGKGVPSLFHFAAVIE